MCLGVPMQIIEINGLTARCQAKGVTREANLLFFQEEPLQVGDFVVVHLGAVVQKLSAEEARVAWELYDEIFAAETGNSSNA